ncbi:MAG: bifunctional FO biosynthesis protein CofGH [Congregibacter sp.]
MSQALLLLKSFPLAKTRLAGELSSEQRKMLTAAMARDVIAALKASDQFSEIHAMVGCAEGARLCGALGLTVVRDTELDGNCMNTRAASWLGRAMLAPTEPLLILHADLPMLDAEDVRRFMQGRTGWQTVGHATVRTQAHPQKSISIATDQARCGSNAILLHPGQFQSFAWGEDSLRMHQALCAERQLQCDVARIPGFALDIDTPPDLQRLVGAYRAGRAVGAATAELIAGSAFSQLGDGHLQQTGSAESGHRVGHRLDKEAALQLADCDDLSALTARAREIRDCGFAGRVTYSPKVFIPLTRLCRDVCHYCTFATTPANLDAAYMSIDQVLEVCREGAELGCTEALFTLGERPELRYRAAREALQDLGFDSTPKYVRAVAEAVIRDTGMLPHLNLGTLSRDEIRCLRPVAASMGIMLESASARLCEPGMPHYGSPDKQPERRLQTLRLMGEERVPVTTGILIGIGETRLERIESLLAIKNLHDEFGHIQEIIVQNFRAKAGTRMASAPEPDLDDLCWTIAVTRQIFGSGVSVQAPPNLSPGVLPRLLDAGLNDWGGVSPLTPDHVNPEAPWPHLVDLAQQSAQAGKSLVPRLPVYPAYIKQADTWIDTGLRKILYDHADASGMARDCDWRAGVTDSADSKAGDGGSALRSGYGEVLLLPKRTATIRAQIHAARSDASQQPVHIAGLFAARTDELSYVLAAADDLRKQRFGDAVSFVVNRNINYTNVCSYACQFCAFSKGGGSKGEVYDLSGQELARRTREAWERGATEVCLQGGIHPDYTGDTYLDVLDTVRKAAPHMHVHAFSPLEVTQGAATLNISVGEYLAELRRRGLGSLPGTAAEVLHDEVRQIICPDKLSTAEWLSIINQAHEQGLRTTATIMFGHVDTPAHWAEHLLAVRDQQRKSAGFTEFVPLPFVAGEAPLYRRGRSRPGPSYREALLMHAIARLVLDGDIDNIQASWVKMGVSGVADCLRAGANDIGGTLMNESITRAAGAAHGQEWPSNDMQAFIAGLSRTAWQRSSLYQPVPEERRRRSASATPLLIPVNDRAGAAATSKRL